MAKEAKDKGEEDEKERKNEELLMHGLTEKEAETRLKEYGPNRIIARQNNPINIFLDHFQIPTIVLLFAIIFWLTVEFTAAILALLFVSAMVIIETVRDLRVRNSIKEIQERHANNILVVRDGVKKTIASSNLVPGDIVLLLPGMRVPADGIVVKGLCKVDESIFGRGIVERKRKERLEEKELPAFGVKEDEDKEYFHIFAGTFILEGEIMMRVEKTGKDTRMVVTIQREPPKRYIVIEKIEEMTDRLTNIMMGITLVIFVVLLYYNVHFLAAFSIAAAAAVAGIPQSILLTARVAFSSSLKRIEGLAIRSDDLPERLSKVTVICTEKMNALSRGEPTVSKLWIDREDAEVSGEGWSRAGKFKGIDDYGTIDMMTQSLIITTSAVPIYKDKGGFYFNDPGEGALVTLAMKNNLPTETIRNENYCIERKTNGETGVVTSVHINPKRERVSYIRGPARAVAELCDFMHSKGKNEKISKNIKEEIEYKIIEMGAGGVTPYAIAFGITEKGKTKYSFLGMMGIYDPPKPEIEEIIEECKSSGIKIVVITEGNESSAVDFARQLNILTPDTKAVLCDQLKFMRDAERSATISKAVVFASATSEYKKLIIDELRAQKGIVMFVDSGIADIPALKSANVSMSLESATEISKYNADAIILNDNFFWAPKSVEESKSLGKVVIRSFYSLFISDFAIIFLVLLSAILMTKTMNVLQILLVNLVADSLIGIGLAMDRPKESGLKTSMKFPSRGTFAFAIFLAVFMSVSVFLIADFFPEEYFTSIATAGIVLCAMMNTFSFSSDESVFKSLPSPRILLAVAISIAFLMIVMYSPIDEVFGMIPLQAQQWGMLMIPAVSMVALMEIKKAIAKD